MNKKNYFIFAAAIALASCSVDEYMGENPEFTQTTKENIIGFGGGTGSMSRATSNTGTTEQKLDKQFKVYGWKTMSDGEGNTTTQKVFDNYWVWYSAIATPSNPEATASPDKSWEYVGNKDKDMPFFNSDTPPTKKKLDKDQYIKYWDYSAKNYKFVAGSPITSFDFQPSTGQVDIATTTVTGLAGHINPNPTGDPINTDPVYIANPKVITSTDYQKAVDLQFTRLQTRVRVGIYETIEGYSISAIKFYKQGTSDLELETGNDKNVILTSSGENFYGGINATATVKYNWDDDNDNTNPLFTYTINNVIKQKNWYGGRFEGIPAISSNESVVSNFYGNDKDMDSQGYFTVIPNNNNEAIIIKCDYTLTSDDGSLETINVKGATAAIPAAYCKWENNKMYTYIFKISQETNGHTGDPNEPGLFPITFDAVATDTEVGTKTIVQTPSITTYQDGSVTANGIEYKTGKEIVITVQEGSTEKTPSTGDSEGGVNVYYLGETEKTEAELVVNRPSGSTKDVTIAGNTAKFTPKASDITGATATYGYYAIEYCYQTSPSTVYKYKVIKVKKVSESSGS